jgi:hypothetical protein
MHIPQTRDEKLASAVNDYGFAWDMCLSRWTNCNDPIALYYHRRVRLRAAAGGINHGYAFDHKRLRPGTDAE